MTTRIDDAIDRVAARMTAVGEDDALALRIAQALPERSQWLPLGWVARFAMGALATLTLAVVLRPFYERSTIVLRTNNDRSTEVLRPFDVSSTREPLAPATSDRRSYVEPTSNDRRTTGDPSRPDHEFSLAAVAAPEALSVGVVDPVDLRADDALAIAPLVIADLPLTADFSPR